MFRYFNIRNFEISKYQHISKQFQFYILHKVSRSHKVAFKWKQKLDQHASS